MAQKLLRKITRRIPQNLVDLLPHVSYKDPKYNLEGKYFTVDVARYILWYCNQQHDVAKQEDLQTILYILQLYFLKEKHKALFMGDFVARSDGPVVPDIALLYLQGNESSLEDCNRPTELFSEETENIIEIIIDSYFATDPQKRSQLARRKGGAWAKIYKRGKGFGEYIPKKKIAEESQELRNLNDVEVEGEDAGEEKGADAGGY